MTFIANEILFNIIIDFYRKFKLSKEVYDFIIGTDFELFLDDVKKCI